MSPVLLCPVRSCHLALAREECRFICARGHAFDVARSGYLNLLQPQERRSKLPGDPAAVLAARRRLHDRGVTEPLLRGIAQVAALESHAALLDAGCGDGFYAGNLAQQSGCEAHGIDISIPAIDAAARRYPGCQWIVGNADRFVPYAPHSFSLVVSITARMNAPEFRRVVREDGRLLVAIPAPDDLIELRGAGRERSTRTIETFASDFTLIHQERVTTTADLDEAAVQDVLLAIYRPLQPQPAKAMQVTFSLDLLLFQPTPAHYNAL